MNTKSSMVLWFGRHAGLRTCTLAGGRTFPDIAMTADDRVGTDQHAFADDGEGPRLPIRGLPPSDEFPCWRLSRRHRFQIGFSFGSFSHRPGVSSPTFERRLRVRRTITDRSAT